MDPKLKHILQLALHPQTGQGEAVAALEAARRIISKQGMPTLWQTPTTVQEKIVYRERPNTNPYLADRISGTLNVPPQDLHEVLEKMFELAYDRDVVLRIKNAGTVHNRPRGKTIIGWIAYGEPRNTKRWITDIQTFHTNKHLKPITRKGFWARLFGK